MRHHIARLFVRLRAGPHFMAAALAGFLIGFPPLPAAAHGEAEWIMNHPDFGWCCGPEDCHWIEAKDVRVDGDDYVAERFSIRWSVVGTFPSADHRFWVCYYRRGTVYEKVKCFFAPPRAM